MLEVLVCEDDKEQREKISKFINDVILIENLDMKLILSTTDPKDVLSHVRQSKSSGLYFLDVDLKADINGIRLAEEIREYDPRGFIVFVTTHAEMSYLTFLYKVEAMDYIVKDNYKNIKDRIHQCILNANKKYASNNNKENKVLSINNGEKVVNIEFKNILFFETSDTIHKIIIHAINRQVEFYGQMKDLEEKLDERFYRCHRAYIVNKENIGEIDKANRSINMINGEQCLVSTRALKGLSF